MIFYGNRMLDQPSSREYGGSCIFTFIKKQYSNKQASISFFVNNGFQMFTITISIVLFESLVQVCNHRYLKPVILTFLVVPDKPKMVTLGYFAIRAKEVGFRDPISYS